MSSEIKKWLDSVLKEVGWNYEDLKSSDEEGNNFSSHKDKFSLSASDETDLDNDSSRFYYESSQSVVQLKLSDQELQKILKNNVVTTKSHLDPQAQLKVYDFCVEKAKRERKKVSQNDFNEKMLPDDCKNFQEPNKSFISSELEMKIKERELKRRRQTYKNKNIYSKNKNYKDVLKNLIENQMEYLKDEMKNKS